MNDKMAVVGGFFSGALSLVGGVAVIVGIIIYYARQGELWAIILLSIMGTLVIGSFFVAMLVAFMFASQRQDERAMQSQMRMMNTNAIENMALMEQTQRAMLMAQRQQTEVSRMAKIQSGIPVLDDTGGDSYLIPSNELYKNLQEQVQ